MTDFSFEATIGLSPGGCSGKVWETDMQVGAAAVAKAVFAMDGARRVTVVTHDDAGGDCLTVEQLDLKAPWTDEGGAVWGLREDVERVAGAALRRA